VPPERGPLRLDASAPGFEKEFSAFLGRNRDTDENVDRVVADIVAAVRARGDAALVEYTRKFDKVDTDAADCIFDAGAGAAAILAQRDALIFAAQRIEPSSRDVAEGCRLHRLCRHASAPAAARSVGVYVPGGTASIRLGTDEHRAGRWQASGASSWSCRRWWR
jgi:histidinol dehydrogenase